ncbi:cytochrome c family protein [Sulfuricurvum kujiense DSM 16994]|uniref:Cytochrome c family protein n=1 Tax=Sulfuricurvum kujiense (strain ATCC BAA-921 / DSM 16994 / JCM 11577 / YK-1) TaxID=709032 RepID=E4U063_SULKY|nr:DUF3365 domain-containing protein [Sulfuricurvum kujiense]ADR34249.1 cytochrome c family protein [Sulfuricurvum kujiense DSM 16994]
MKRFIVIPLTLASSLLLASSSADEQAIAKGNQASALLVQKLGGELKIQMQSNSALGALNFCSQNALTLTEQVAKETKTSMKRLSLKNRNPLNAPTPQEAALLNRWETLAKNGEPLPPHELVNVSDTAAVYYKPILINNEACLKCHGNVEGELAKAIRAAYPDDKATGYKMGDLRGMIAVEMAR